VKVVLYVRVAHSNRFRLGYKAVAATSYNPDPITVGRPGGFEGEEKLHTAHFCLRIDVPDELLKPASIPTIEIELDPALVTTVTPAIEVEQEQAPEPQPEEEGMGTERVWAP
jgi:hypothetical protein